MYGTWDTTIDVVASNAISDQAGMASVAKV
jgi:hypothetical protein